MSRTPSRSETPGHTPKPSQSQSTPNREKSINASSLKPTKAPPVPFDELVFNWAKSAHSLRPNERADVIDRQLGLANSNRDLSLPSISGDTLIRMEVGSQQLRELDSGAVPFIESLYAVDPDEDDAAEKLSKSFDRAAKLELILGRDSETIFGAKSAVRELLRQSRSLRKPTTAVVWCSETDLNVSTRLCFRNSDAPNSEFVVADSIRLNARIPPPAEDDDDYDDEAIPRAEFEIEHFSRHLIPPLDDRVKVNFGSLMSETEESAQEAASSPEAAPESSRTEDTVDESQAAADEDDAIPEADATQNGHHDEKPFADEGPEPEGYGDEETQEEEGSNGTQ